MTPVEDTDLILVIVYTSIAFLLMAAVLVLFYYFSKQKIVQKELEKRDLTIEHQKEMLHSIILTQEQERQRIAQDLHDDISSKLNIVSLNGHLLQTPGLSEVEFAAIRTNIVEMTGKALENARRIAHDLLPPVLEKFGLVAGIEELAQEVIASRGAKVVFESDIPSDKMPQEQAAQLQVFRVLQELLNNSLRHGKAENITIRFTRQRGRRICHYTDDGIGMPPDTLQKSKGLGLSNIQNRIEILGGQFTISSPGNKGVVVSFTF